ncbi:hypothetical protein [Lentzea sp. NBC_00516]|uniref:hypothetical protein n=1 Tax=Lentzea sp. NBC_00516 TaxID=2903582 RepID=UPI003FA5F261
MTGLHQDDLVDVLLVVTERVSNVYDHARFPARLRLRKSGEPCVVRISVEDASASAPVMRPSSSDSPRGRGMAIVNQTPIPASGSVLLLPEDDSQASEG